MTRASRLSRFAALLGGAVIIAAACTGSTPASAPPASAAASEPAASGSAAAENFTGISYPESGDAPCGVAPYTGTIKKITAIDRLTVEFQLCAPDVAFLPKAAFSTFGIQDADYLAAHAPDKTYLTQPNGTGPYKLAQWDTGNRMDFEAYDGYWGDAAKAPKAELRWSDTAAQRLVELKSGSIDGMDNPGRDEITQIKGDSTLQFMARPPMNTMYIGMNRAVAPWDNENVRKAIAMGINRQQIVDNFYPEGSEVATHFTPCPPLVPFGCEGDDWYQFDAAAAKKLLTDANFDFSKTYPLSFRAAVRPYNPDPPVIATEIQSQLRDNLGIETSIDLQESGAFTKAVTAGEMTGLFVYGWGADYPDVTNFLDFHFGSGSGKKFGGPFDDIAAALTKGAASPSDADRQAAYKDANNLIKQHVPVVPIAHGATGTAYKADVEGGQASPLTTEILAAMKPGDRDTMVFMQNAEPLSLYCGDESDGETLRACEQVFESLYAYELNGTKPVPSLATECTPNDDLTTWTCKLRDGVTFHDGATLDANDVVTTYAVQWDAKHPLHIGNSGAFEYWGGLFGGFLNPPAS
jgi:peptide/nickel transport system substrate-binding protein